MLILLQSEPSQYSWFITFLQLLIPVIAIIISSIIGFYQGKKRKINDVKIEKAFEIAERLSDALITINEEIDYLIEFYIAQYDTKEYNPEHVDNFVNHLNGIFSTEKTSLDRIERSAVIVQKNARIIDLYTKNNLRTNLKDFLKHISFESSEAIGFNDYFFKMFELFLSEDFLKNKEILFQSALKKINNLDF